VQLSLSPPLLAGPPLETDDPATPCTDRWKINVSTTLEKRRDAWEWTPLLDFNYGVGERIQLKLKRAMSPSMSRPRASAPAPLTFRLA